MYVLVLSRINVTTFVGLGAVQSLQESLQMCWRLLEFHDARRSHKEWCGCWRVAGRQMDALAVPMTYAPDETLTVSPKLTELPEPSNSLNPKHCRTSGRL